MTSHSSTAFTSYDLTIISAKNTEWGKVDYSYSS
jgi:hypothetical protein